MRLSIPAQFLAEIIAHARETAPDECCGLLAGRIHNGEGIATARFAIANDLSSPTRYRTNPKDLFAAFRAIRHEATDVLAVYHSHPAAAALPSRRDVEENTYGETVVHLIVGLAGKVPEVQAWWLTEEGYREAEWHCERGATQLPATRA
jgi:proteasome lid subunit RPN8/RPN11